MESKSIVKYEIPLKDNLVQNTYAFNWIDSLSFNFKYKNSKSSVTKKELIEEISFMHDKPDDENIKRKHKNTNKFIKHVLTPEFIETYNQAGKYNF